MKKNQLVDEYAGFFEIQKERMLGCCKTSGKYWVIVATLAGSIPLAGVQSGFRAVLPCIIAELFFFFVLLFIAYKKDRLQIKHKKIFFKTIKIESEKAEEHIVSLIQIVAIFFALCITITVFACSYLFKNNSTGYYIFAYPWSKDINIFTITRCFNFICIIGFSLFILMRVLTLLASLLSSKQETVMRLCLSFVRYFGWLAAACYCLNLLGMPTGSLIASAGVMTAIFSIGAQSIVADILTGLFIIFEGSFKVGDMITVDDWHGQVVEIGIRNTRIRDLINNDVKIMNNSTIKKVINFSEYPTLCKIRIGIEYDSNIEELEEIFEREKDVIKKNLPASIGLFRYLGVDEFTDSSILLKFEASCKNEDYDSVKRALNREIKLMFDRNGIKVPFPQIVLHESED